MEKLTLEQLAPYLAYGLKVQLTNDQSEDFDELIDMISDKVAFRKGAIWSLIGYADGNFSIPMGEGEIDGFILGRNHTYCSLHHREFKPILRPLSDLTKEIDHNGERFVPIDYINGQFALSIPTKIEWNQSVKNSNLHFVLAEWIQPQKLYSLFELLFKWHFDVFGLIAAGLAVNLNDL